MRSVDRLRRAFDRGMRRATHRRRALPDFVIVGAQKSGTSSAYHWLSQHPGVVPASRKELHYFDSNSDRPLAWYRSHFPLRSELGERRITGEASPSYMFYPHAIRRLAARVPDARIVVMLRDPVRRAVSHYYHQVRLGHETLPVQDALREDVEAERIAGLLAKMRADPSVHDRRVRYFSYRARGDYAPQLENLGRWFPMESTLILIAEELFAAPSKHLARIETFLGLSAHPSAPALPHRNVGRYSDEPPDEVLADLIAYFEPRNRRVADRLGRSLPWSGFNREHETRWFTSATDEAPT